MITQQKKKQKNSQSSRNNKLISNDKIGKKNNLKKSLKKIQVNLG
jgi:hypothetical protein